ncbi:type II secretion system inner membrane protein GspF [Pseudoalteromonas sp. SR44-5]|jgi:general secretion pathway protein F|uniref:General secretion pathway protein F n=2 Tax=Pseudoalteromonas TaxID=53246 RepID=A0ABY3F764_9GAMM|nr:MULTISPECIES: type II secretion system inner membrane protein GspF [Pseudoalteromonas]MBB1295421.1 type II secretion system inner membrane protein GspF [Pseudoalteromonas sp. SR41-4]MBB1303619.1 type II secretion system inner membrane protein GspF [Pseudoalteromonas sp. SR44-8]MBB1335531.1 type II secretion system inner membrane protein GspF [Pseudoalteromonas sp. SR41-6]MBB1343738.1 type II secretion system inner membrane protein GspF [Pseudoalteromonas sp. SR45-6]MBB1368769.1 type II secr|tara:strand:+ start:11872 stop:13107 length:1236 start_codon:yes stop_codon:yes gene_type:complete
MAAFEYRALDARGKEKKGIQEADTAKQIRQSLREQGLTPLEVVPAAEGDKQVKGEKSSPFGSFFKAKISTSDLALITRQLATLIQSALPVEGAVMAVAEQCEKPRMKRMLMSVRSKVVEGYTLADGMSEFPHVFDNLYRAMVAAGEKSGHLDAVLNRLADYTEQRQHMRSQITQAMVYPVILVIFAIGIVSILLGTVVPKILKTFEKSKQVLPWTTEWVMAASNYVQNYWFITLVLFTATVIGVKHALKQPKIRFWYDSKILMMPGIGKVARSINTARFARTLSILSSSSVPLLEGMRISGGVLINEKIKKAVADAATRVSEGASLRASLQQTKLFPPMMLHMIASGEKSGELEQMLERAANNQDREFETMVNVSLKLLEPAMIASMAVIVLFIVMAILQPIMAMNKAIGL